MKGIGSGKERRGREGTVGLQRESGSGGEGEGKWEGEEEGEEKEVAFYRLSPEIKWQCIVQRTD